MQVTTIHPAAWHAVYAASHRDAWGKVNARAYAVKHGASRLYTLALQLQAVTL